MRTLRSVVFRFRDISALSLALEETRGSLPLPEGEPGVDGEWILAIFEIGSRRRATAAAARCVLAAGDPHVEFERRDWDRLQSFAAARSEHMRAARPITTTSSGRLPAALESPFPMESELPPASVPIESTRVPLGSRVLIVDADPVTRTDICTMLAEIGLNVEAVPSPEEAAERMRAVSFDALVLDFNAKGQDPLAFVRGLRRDPLHSPLPVLFLSSHPSSRDEVEAFASGADDFLPKPFRAAELGARIYGLLRRARLLRANLGPGATGGTP